MEHAFQSYKFVESQHNRFEVGGDLSDFEALRKFAHVFYTKKVASDQKAVEMKIAYWSNKNLIGIVAKMASKPKHALKLGLTFTEDNFNGVEVMRSIIPHKFEQNPKLKKILLSTNEHELVEFSRTVKYKHEKGQQEEFWCGIYVNGTLYGHNKMGQLLMEVRDKLITV